MKNKSLKLLLLLVGLAILGCEKDDLENDDEEGYYRDALITAKADNILGNWAIFEVNYQGVSAEIPVEYESCGRDFFQFLADGKYKEYTTIDTYQCERAVNTLSWELDNGVIHIFNSFGDSQELVITRLTENEFIFKSRLDIDEDGEEDIINFRVRSYNPPDDPDLFSMTFQADFQEGNAETITYSWQPYQGFYNFDRYEIYRSSTCNKSAAELVSTINEISATSFTDNSPLKTESFCYFLRIYNENGLLGESPLIPFPTEALSPSGTHFTNIIPQGSGDQLLLQWEAYQGIYFSHYNIRVRNYLEGSGAYYIHEDVTKIYDQSITEFIDEHPPYIKNPVYVIEVVDIFGNVSNSYGDPENAMEVNWKRAHVLDYSYIQFYTIDPDTPFIYVLGYHENSYATKVQKIDYTQSKVMATMTIDGYNAQQQPQIHHTENGPEYFLSQGGTLKVYDATDLRYKYDMNPKGLGSFDDFEYFKNNIWVFSFNDSVFTYKRENKNLNRIDARKRSTSSFSLQKLMKLNGHRFLMNGYSEATSTLFSINNEGKIKEENQVNYTFTTQWSESAILNTGESTLLNFTENRLYDADQFQLLSSFEEPVFPTGISDNGDLIFGSNNNPEWFPSNESAHEKMASIYNWKTKKLETITTKGYPMLIFEGENGDIISLSAGMKRDKLTSSLPRPDLFFEKLK